MRPQRIAEVLSGGVARGEEIAVEGLVLSPVKAATLGLIEIAVGVTALALSARFSVTVPGYPVPFTLQTLALGVIVVSLGPRSWRVVASYIAAGLLGLPVFAYGGGAWYVASPTFGYIIGFLVASVIVGRAARPLSYRRGVTLSLAMLPPVYLPGVIWLTLWMAVFREVSIASAFSFALTRGALVFIPWDLAKAVAAAMLSRLLARLVYRI